MLEILYQDDHIVAINKPPGLLVHRSPIAHDVTEFALQMLRDQLDKKVFLAHRLDRKTSGVLLFTFDKDTLRGLTRQFEAGQITKKYLAIVRGHTEEQATVDYPICDDSGKSRNAITHFRTLARAELEVPSGKHATSRYSLVEASPETGRMHQLRKHFSHIFHPIIGDRPHGCNKQNKLFKELWQMEQMMLHASDIGFMHPVANQHITIAAPLHQEFIRMKMLMGFDSI